MLISSFISLNGYNFKITINQMYLLLFVTIWGDNFKYDIFFREREREMSYFTFGLMESIVSVCLI